MSWIDYALLVVLVLAIVATVSARRSAREVEHRSAVIGRERAAALSSLRAAEERLQIAMAQTNALGEAALNALLVIDGNRRIVWGNQLAWTMFGEGQPAVGQPFIALVRDYELNQTAVDALSGHRAVVRQAVVNERQLRIRVMPLEDADGAAVAVEDVTELQRLGRARRDLVANISHELRTPLANIDLAAQTLQNGDLTDGTTVKRMLTQIGVQVQALSQLSEEMMDLSQIESGRVLLKLIPIDLLTTVTTALGVLRPQAEAKGQRISVDVAPDLTALIDPEQIARVIRNLVHNAIKFTPETGSIALCGQPYGEEDVLVSVSDSGPGIPESERDRVFERFYKQDRARSRGGTGLGLAIAKHIVEGHGGQIWVESDHGHGAKFCFTVPRS